jgi:hypothetical protein
MLVEPARPVDVAGVDGDSLHLTVGLPDEVEVDAGAVQVGAGNRLVAVGPVEGRVGACRRERERTEHRERGCDRRHQRPHAPAAFAL